MTARQGAIRLLAVCASTREWGIALEAKELDTGWDAQDLALAAWRHVDATGVHKLRPFGTGNWEENWGRYFDICAEAEALLHTGWAP